jgi:hypothetical protein
MSPRRGHVTVAGVVVVPVSTQCVGTPTLLFLFFATHKCASFATHYQPLTQPHVSSHLDVPLSCAFTLSLV